MAANTVASVRIHLTKPAKQSLDQLCERAGMTQQAVAERTMAWLVSQPKIVQALVLGQIDEEAALRLLKTEARDGAIEAAGEQLAGDVGKILAHAADREGKASRSRKTG